MKAFEIHTYQSGKWKIDSVFDDRELVLFEAHRTDDSGRFTGVRVIEEVYDAASETSTVRTLFRGSKIAHGMLGRWNAASRTGNRSSKRRSTSI